MNIFAASGLINAVLILSCAVFVFLKNQNSVLKVKYSVYSFTALVWCSAYFLWQISSTAGSALFWCRWLMAGAIFIPVTFLDFASSFLGVYEKQKKFILYGYLIFGAFLLADLTGLFVRGVAPKMMFPFWPEPGVLFGPFLAVWALYFVYPCYLLLINYKNYGGVKRNQILYLLAAMVVGISGGSTNYLLWYDIHIPPYGNILVSVYIFITAYAIFKYRLMDIRLAISRAGVFVILYSLILGVPFLTGYLTGSWFIATIMACIFASFGPVIYGKLRVKADEFVLSEQRKYQKVLQAANEDMSGEYDLGKLLRSIVGIITDNIDVNFAAIFMYNPVKKTYELKSLSGEESGAYAAAIPEFPENIPFITHIKEQVEPVLFEEMPVALQNSVDFPRKISLVVPSRYKKEIFWFLMLGERSKHALYSYDDINIFKILSKQASIAIENITYVEGLAKAKETERELAERTKSEAALKVAYDHLKRTQDQLLQSDKMAAVGQLAAGIAHEINNPISIIMGFAQSVAKGLTNDNPLYMPLHSIEREAKRCKSLVSDFLTFSRNYKYEREQCDINEVIRGAVSLFETHAKFTSVSITKELWSGMDKISINPSQIRQVIVNLCMNGIEAMKSGGKLTVMTLRADDYVEIRITDTGKGIPKELQSKIFEPFFTTKEVGMGAGLGLSLAYEIVQQHGGRITLESEVGKGSTFKVFLPLKGEIKEPPDVAGHPEL